MEATRPLPQVVLEPYSLYTPPTFNSTEPTASPVAPYSIASLTFTVTNRGDANVSAPWSLELSHPGYQSISQVASLAPGCSAAFCSAAPGNAAWHPPHLTCASCMCSKWAQPIWLGR